MKYTNLAHTDNPTESRLIARALKCLETRLRYGSDQLNSSQNVFSYLRLNLAVEKSEVFAVLFLTNQNRLLAFEKLFKGTINEAPVYPRVVVQKALELNAAGIILAHNHPSGNCEPSRMDREITQKLKEILKIIDVRVVDHVIVAQDKNFSFVENGLL